MTYETFKEQVRKAGLGIKDFAVLVDMNHRSLSNYSKREAVPKHLALISLMMVELERHDVDFKTILGKLDKMGRPVRKRQQSGFKGKMRSDDFRP